ncbi:MAG TPA: ABC transporter permease [Phycisphaerales bacterium]|nr:ABC transporter permease [Phycisphaerales bacterium]HCD32318.1 ABC transporter permease [Phycisphaerales bacterium]|tara:strand:+ start:42539 stop:43354 length:816 start_codon:yes stop_codon:yes gene_type:complete
MIAKLNLWWMIFRISLAERLVYRGDFMLSTFVRFLPIITQILLWTAVIGAGDSDNIKGMKIGDIIAYYLLVTVARAFSSMPGLTHGIAGEIRDGEIKKYLIQPIDLIGFLLVKRIAHKLVYYMIAFVPFAIVFFLLREYFSGWPPVHTLMAFGASLLLAFCIGFFLEATFGFIAFWWLEVTSLMFIYMLMNFFFSGHMFPLDFLPDWLRNIFDCLPFQYMAYFPCAVFLGRMTEAQVIHGLWIGLGWAVFFCLTANLSFKWGVRRYSGFGG